MLSFTTAHAAIVALRVKDPDRERPYKAPWNVRIKGSLIPMTAVIGGIGTFAAWIAVTVLHSEARIVGIPWMIVGMCRLLLLPQKARALTRASPTGLPRPERPADFEELDYRTALVPIFGDDVSADGAGERRQADRRGRRRLRDLRAARAQPALARGGSRGGGGAGALGARERPHPGKARGDQDPHGPDPHAQPGLGARRRSRTRRLGRHLLVDDPRAERRAADRPDRGVPAEQAALPGDHRDARTASPTREGAPAPV